MSNTEDFINVLEPPIEPAKWNIYEFSRAISEYPGPELDLLDKYIMTVHCTNLRTNLYAPDSTEYFIASEHFLYCGKANTPLQLYGGRYPVPWEEVTTEMVNQFLAELAHEFADYIHRSAICNLCDSNEREGTTLEARAMKLKEIVEKIMPDKIPSYINMSQDMHCDLLGRFHEDDTNICLIQAMKYDLIDYISKI